MRATDNDYISLYQQLRPHSLPIDPSGARGRQQLAPNLMPDAESCTDAAPAASTRGRGSGGCERSSRADSSTPTRAPGSSAAPTVVELAPPRHVHRQGCNRASLGDCSRNGVTGGAIDYRLAVSGMRSWNDTARTFRIGFQRVIHRCCPVPFGSRDRTAR
jgi:hypothetical protein